VLDDELIDPFDGALTKVLTQNDDVLQGYIITHDDLLLRTAPGPNLSNDLDILK